MSELFRIEHSKFTLIGTSDAERMKLFLSAAPKKASADAGQVDQRAEQGADQKVEQKPDQKLATKTEGTLDKPIIVTRQELLDALSAQLKVDDAHIGVIDDVATQLSANCEVKDRRIAKGQLAQPGANGKLLLLVKPFTGQADHQADDHGFGKLSNLHLFDNVPKGTVVARLYPPKPGVAGKDVLGKELPAPPGQPAKLQTDKSVKIESSTEQGEKFDKIVAELDGLLLFKSSELKVSEILEIKDDLDLKFGNVDFIGAVKVKGSVAPDMNVRARTGLEIGGNIQGGLIECSAGDILLRGFLFSGERGRVVSGKNVFLNVAQEAHIEALGDINIAKECVSSTLRTGASILAAGAKIVGGECYAVCGVEAKVLGSDSGTNTVIHLCSNVESSSDYAKIVADIANHERAINLLELHLGPHAKDPTRIANLAPKLKEHMQKLFLKLTGVKKSLEVLFSKQKGALASAKINKSVRVNFHEKLYPGVIVVVGEKSYTAPEPLKGPATLEYIAEKQEFVLGALQGIECSFSLVDEVKDAKKSKK